eukprot:CAMPEP_0194373574 /NCGR_PEP_ID=MMETSP0174-20130528/22060_1 /TAXON_ID=216777 /ORGANISM="Proboscia alata, Strain PI-D3" /LENGTH=453 /DNA_ID=CAMNT_0039152757 /DNA_START=218 /DNA_END=1576 /DNA_ORIENTATION=-
MVAVVMLYLQNTEHHGMQKKNGRSAFSTQKSKENSGTVRSTWREGTAPSSAEIENLNQRLSSMPAEDILRWACSYIPTGELVQVTSFGPTGMVILHMLHSHGFLDNQQRNMKLQPKRPNAATVSIVSIDTLHLFQESYQHTRKVKQTYDISIHWYFPKDFNTTTSFDDAHGPDLYKTNPDTYDLLTKIEPSVRALRELKVSGWISGRRRDQGGERGNLPIVEMDGMPETGPAPIVTAIPRIKINPLAFWTHRDIWLYIHQHDIPYNILHDSGYKSVGDVMTTIPVKENDPERAGRFVGMNKTECGLHSHLARVKQLTSEGPIKSIPPTIPCPHCLELNSDNFDRLVLGVTSDGVATALTKDLLIEFYSPWCEACQEAGPHFSQIATALRSRYKDQIAVGRFDVTEHDIPNSAEAILHMKIESTPTIYLVQQNPLPTVSEYFSEHHDVATVLDW